MIEIETLTEEERSALEAAAQEGALHKTGPLIEKALRILYAQAERIAELEAKCGQLTRNALLDASEWRGRVLQLEAQLPEDMKHCTIRFLECPVGHGRLTATNWVASGCLTCRIAELERVESLAKRSDNYQTALEAWSREIGMRQAAEARIAELEAAIVESAELLTRATED